MNPHTENDPNEIGPRLPRDFYDLLDAYVAGQHEAKKSIATALYNHLLRIGAPKDIVISKSNILMLGPTGSGKTYLLQQLARECAVPMYIADATTLSERGYVGSDVESILTGLFLESKSNLSMTEKGIVYLDEIDKLAGIKGDKDVSGFGVQRGLLKLMEGTKVMVSVDFSRESRKVEIDTSNILFVFGGAFNNLEESKIKEASNTSIGFLSQEKTNDCDVNKLRQSISTKDIVDYGFMPEFMGRCPVTIILDDLTDEDLKSILMTKKNCLWDQYKQLFQLDGLDLTFEDGAITAVIDHCKSKKIGARGLKTAMELVLKTAMFERVQEYCTITEKFARGKLDV